MMAISKRIRYEILNRDHYTCQYCGASAPQVELQIDHVIPKALGGADEPSNLVTACRDCNAGKTSANPDADKVAQVDEKAVAMAKAFRDYLTEYGAQKAKDAEWLDSMESFWWETAEEYGLSYAYLEYDNRVTWVKWRGLGITDDILKDAIREAMARPGISQRNTYRYMCGIVWNIIRKATDAAASAIEPAQKRCGHCDGCTDGTGQCSLYGPFEDDEEPGVDCPYCDDPHCLYEFGFEAGIQDGIAFEHRRMQSHPEESRSDGH